MMVRDQCPFKLANPWPQIGWWAAISMVAVSVILGFLVLSRLQQNGPELGMWTAICTALGITADSGPAGEPQPPLRTPTRLAWTEATREAIASGDAEHGAFVALNCGACHGEQGVSQSSLIPTLAGMDAAAIYKQLDDYQSRKRLWGVMNGIAMALTLQDRSDVAAYLASRTGPSPHLRRRPETGDTAMFSVSWPGRTQIRSARLERTARRLHRTPIGGVCTGYAPKRHQPANAHHRCGTNARGDARSRGLLRGR
jgi:cytochrome c553